MARGLAAFIFALGLGIGTAPAAPRGAELQLKLVGEGRYEELATRFEGLLQNAKAPAAELHGLCIAYHRIKHYQRLGECLDKLEARIKAGDREGLLFGAEDLTPYAAILRAESANELGDPDRAIAEAGRALDWYDREKEDAPLVEMEALTALVVALARVGEPDAARGYLRRLEKIRTGFLFSNEHKTSKSLALARCHLALGDYEKAYQALSGDALFEANAFLDRLFSGALLGGDNLWLWQDLPRQYMLGKALLETGRTEEAKRRLSALAGNARVRQNGEIYWQVLHDLGRLSRDGGDLKQAEDFFRQAVALIEQHRRHIDTEINKIGFATDRQQVYADLVDVLFRQGRFASMLEFMERAKARALVDLLAEKWRREPPAGRDGAVGQQLERIDRLEEAARLQKRGGGETDRSDLDQARQSLFERDPMFASLVAIHGVDADRLRAALGADESLLEYYARGDVLYALVADAGGIHAIRLDGTDLARRVEDFRRAIAARSPDALPQARALYDALWRPLAARLRGRVTLVPHGPLHYLPFAALHDGEGWLARKHGLRVLPSANAGLLLGGQGAAGNALILANPDTGVAANDLVHAEAEANAIAERLPGARLLTRGRASESALRGLAGDARYVHLASHGKFQSADPLKSYLLLSPDKDNDGVLSVDEIYGLRLNADLVALSACETGLGRGNAGDDLVGFSRGFFFAGARALLASYWAVDDAATADLMRAFYANLARGDKAEALRRAQLELMAARPEPFYWAAFYLAGRDR